MDLKCEVSAQGGCTVISPAGEVDVYTAPVLRQQLVELLNAEEQCLIVDFTRIDFIDSTGLGILVGALRRARTMGAAMSIAGQSASAKKLFAITGLDRVFEAFDTVDAAVQEHGAHER
jgi:anti-sigma B factor antagonist